MNEKKTGFDDIVLEKNPKGGKMKKILVNAIILIIVFLIVLIIMKFLNSGPKEEVSPNTPVPPAPIEQKQTFENTPIVQEKKDDEYTKLLESMKEKEGNTSDTFKDQVPPPPAEEKAANEQASKELKVLEEKSSTDDAKKLVNEAFVKPGLDEEEKHEVKKKDLQKVSKEKAVKKAKTAKKLAKEESTSPKDLFSNLGVKGEGELSPGKYIQLYSVSKVDPNSKALKNLRAKNYKYIVYKIQRDGKNLNKILIGPVSPDKLSETLAKIKKDISKGAYSFAIK